MTQTTTTPVMGYGVRPPLARRINWRMLTIVAVLATLVGFPVYTFVKAQSNGGIEHTAQGELVDLKALGNFPFNDTTGTLADVPAQFRALDGKAVILDGFCFGPNSAAGGATQFQFVYNVSKCCNGGPPLVQERVFATAAGDGAQVPDQFTMARISGILHVNVVKADGKVQAVFTMDVKRLDVIS